MTQLLRQVPSFDRKCSKRGTVFQSLRISRCCVQFLDSSTRRQLKHIESREGVTKEKNRDTDLHEQKSFNVKLFETRTDNKSPCYVFPSKGKLW